LYANNHKKHNDHKFKQIKHKKHKKHSQNTYKFRQVDNENLVNKKNDNKNEYNLSTIFDM
jgi:hypothetical protein